jgi:hypothetical protein
MTAALRGLVPLPRGAALASEVLVRRGVRRGASRSAPVVLGTWCAVAVDGQRCGPKSEGQGQEELLRGVAAALFCHATGRYMTNLPSPRPYCGNFSSSATRLTGLGLQFNWENPQEPLV